MKPNHEDRGIRTVVRACIDEKMAKNETATAPGPIGLASTDALCLLMVRTATEKGPPVEPWRRMR